MLKKVIRLSGAAAGALVALSTWVVMPAAAAAPPPAASRPAATAEKVSLNITRQEVVAGGHRFERGGAYEKLVGTIDFQLNPSDPRNAVIVDLDKAPRNAQGLVEYSSDFYLLRPVDLNRWNHELFFEVNNRGNKTWRLFQGQAALPNDPTSLADFGNGFFLNQGFAIAWAGWEGDVLPGNNRMTIREPIPTNPDGGPITQRITVEFHDRYFNPNGGTTCLPLSGSPGFASYPAVVSEEGSAELRVRPSDSPRPSAPDIPVGTLIPRSQWFFASPTEICLPSGFKDPGVYELSYVAQDPRVMGLGYAATRDTASFLRFAKTDSNVRPNPLAGEGGVHHALAEGTSSSGMYMRDYIFQGFNEDLAGRRVFDGIHIHIPGAQKLFLDYRFAQPNPFSTQHRDRYMPYVEFPFNFGVRENPLVAAGIEKAPIMDGILKRPKTDPLVIQTDSSSEYWDFQASLVDTDGFGHDVLLPWNARHYLLGGTQHGATAGVPPALGLGQQLSNPTLYGPAIRALFTDLSEWVTKGIPAPPSQRPTIGNGLLVPSDQSSVGFPRIPGVNYNGLYNAAGEHDRGPGVSQNRGIISNWSHAPVLATYQLLVPKVTEVGIDRGGVDVPDAGVPTATLTGWNLRRAPYTEGDLVGLTGMFIPLPVTPSQAQASGDPRPSLLQLYCNHDGYVDAVEDFSDEMVQRRLLLPEDAEQLVEAAENSSVLQGLSCS